MREFALGLAAHGFRRGDLLAVIGDNRPRLYWAQLAAQCLGGVAVPVYQDSIAAELVYVLDHAEVSVIVAEDQEQVDKILAIKAQLRHLDLVIFDDPRGLQHYDMPFLNSFDEVQAAGRDFDGASCRLSRGRDREGRARRSGASSTTPPAPPATPKG